MLSQCVKVLEFCIAAEDWPFDVWAKANCGNAKVITAETTIASFSALEILLCCGAPCRETKRPVEKRGW